MTDSNAQPAQDALPKPGQVWRKPSEDVLVDAVDDEYVWTTNSHGYDTIDRPWFERTYRLVQTAEGEPVEQAQPTYEWGVEWPGGDEPSRYEDEESARYWAGIYAAHGVRLIRRPAPGPWEKVT